MTNDTFALLNDEPVDAPFMLEDDEEESGDNEEPESI